MVFSKVLNLISSKNIVSITILHQILKQKVFRKKVFKIVLLVMGAILNSFSSILITKLYLVVLQKCLFVLCFRSTTVLNTNLVNFENQIFWEVII
jgi:hypothetical protein